MNLLVCCEESQEVCKAFRAKGHRAFSCDIQKSSGGFPQWHICADVLPLINGNCTFITEDGKEHNQNGKWDMLIAHPECRYMSNAGACRMYPKKGLIDAKRLEKAKQAKVFFMAFYNADCDKIVIENPVPMKIVELPPYTQIVEPYEHGEPYTKKTCLWEKGVPKLMPSNIVTPLGGWVCGNSEIWKKQAAQGKVYGKEKSAKHRSKTFTGIAVAFADQWG